MTIQMRRIVAVGMLVALGAWGTAAAEPAPPQIWIQDTLKGGHTWGSITNLAFSPDGKLLASANEYDGKVCLWDVAAAKARTILRHNRVVAVAFSPDGKTLASGGRRTIELWDVAGGKNIDSLKVDVPVYSVVFSPDGKALSALEKELTTVLNEEERTVWIEKAQMVVWDLKKKEQVRSWKMPFHRTGPVVAYSSIKRPVAVVVQPRRGRPHDHQPFSLIDAFTGESVLDCAGHDSGTACRIAMDRAETIIVSVGGWWNPSVRLWKRATGEHIATFRWPTRADSFVISPDAQIVALNYGQGLRLYEVSSGRLLATQVLVGVGLLAFSPDGRVLASTDGWNIKLWTMPAAWRKKDK